MAVAIHAAGEWKLRERRQDHPPYRPRRALRLGIEFAQRLHRVAQQLDAHRLGSFRRKHVENSATHAELPFHLY